MKENTERVVNPTKIKARLDKDGELVFSRQLDNGEYFDIDTRKDDLDTAICSTLWPLGNFKDTLNKEDDDPGALYFLLEDMLHNANDKISAIVEAVTEKIGNVYVYRCDESSRQIRRGEVLGISIKEVTQ